MKRNVIMIIVFGCMLVGCSKRDDFFDFGEDVVNEDQNEPEEPMVNSLDFSFYYGFDCSSIYGPAWREGSNKYHRMIYLGFGIDEGQALYDRGIREFSVGVRCLNGNITNTAGYNSNYSAYVEKDGNTVWFTGPIYNNYSLKWNALVFLHNLTSPTAKVEVYFRCTYNGEYYYFGSRTDNLTYTRIAEESANK